MKKKKSYRTSILVRELKTNTSYDVLLAGEKPARVGRRMVAGTCQASDACWVTHGGESKIEKMMMSDNEAISGATQNGCNDYYNHCTI